jgi:uncharacterized membrane protein
MMVVGFFIPYLRPEMMDTLPLVLFLFALVVVFGVLSNVAVICNAAQGPNLLLHHQPGDCRHQVCPGVTTVSARAAAEERDR